MTHVEYMDKAHENVGRSHKKKYTNPFWNLLPERPAETAEDPPFKIFHQF